jgi:hypothetical protein
VSDGDPGPSRRLPSWLTGTSRWLVLGGGIAVIATVVGLVFTFFPDLKPKPKTDCPALGGTLSHVQPTGDYTRGEYLALEKASTANMTTTRLDQAGELISFDFATQGYLGKTLTIETRVLTAGGAPVAGPELDIPLAMTIVPRACTDGGQRDVWSVLPPAAGSYRVELRLLDPNGQALDHDVTGAIAVRGGR